MPSSNTIQLIFYIYLEIALGYNDLHYYFLEKVYFFHRFHLHSFQNEEMRKMYDSRSARLDLLASKDLYTAMVTIYFRIFH